MILNNFNETIPVLLAVFPSSLQTQFKSLPRRETVAYTLLTVLSTLNSIMKDEILNFLADISTGSCELYHILGTAKS